MRIRFSLTVAFLVCLGLTVPQFAVCGTYTNFDVAGSTRMVPTAVNNTGQATGWWTDSALANHGFLFQPDGSVTTFDVSQGTETIPVAINGPGKIVGYYTDTNHLMHGFLRNLAGEYTTINAPGAGCIGTWAESIDDAGEISGGYWDTNCAAHAFARDAAGNYTTFDIVPSMGEVSNSFINPGGEIAGSYYSVSGNSSAPHGFTRDNLGNIVTFDAVSGAYWTEVAGVNSTGQIAGYYAPTMNSASAPYFRDAFGNITIFSVTGFYYVAGITDNGDAVGIYQATNFSYRGWLRNSAGVISSFKDPSAGGRRNQGTYPTCVSANGKVAGYYVDSEKVTHGFVLH
jgi:hypothetical protein